MSNIGTGSEDRVIALKSGLPVIPERLLLAHARGEVLFICGAGISRPANLPDFRELVLDVYAILDSGVHAVISGLPRDACNLWEVNSPSLTERQMAEVKRFIVGDYDVVLGMLERRLDDQTRGDSRVRREVASRLRSGCPIMPTMWALRSTTSSLNSGAGRKGDTRPSRSRRLT